MMENDPKTGFNMNSLVIAVATAVILGVVGWFGTKSVDNNDKLTRLEVSLPYLVQSIADLKIQVAGLVTRGELDSRFNELKVENMKQSEDIRRLKHEPTEP